MLALAAIAAVGTIYQAQATSAAAKSNANLSRENATLATQAAAAEARRHRKQSEGILAHIRGQYANAGVTLEGSPMDVLQDSAASAELDNMLITYGGQLKARGYNQQADIYGMEAKNAMTAGYINAASGMLLTGGNTYNQRMKRTSSVGVGE